MTLPPHTDPRWELVAGTADIAAVAARAAAHLLPPFMLWLDGDVGAGKTTWVRALLRHLGLPPSEPVPSPTYGYVQVYHIGQARYAHLDLYRAGSQLSLEDLGLDPEDDWTGILIEWPLALPHWEQRQIQYCLRIEPGQHPGLRRYRFFAPSPTASLLEQGVIPTAEDNTP